MLDALIEGIKRLKGEQQIDSSLKDLSRVYGDGISETLVLDLARAKEVKEPEVKLRLLAEHPAIIYTSPTTIKENLAL